MVTGSTLVAVETFALCELNGTYVRKMVYALAGNYLGVTLRSNLEALLELKRRRALLDWFDGEMEKEQ